MTGMRRRSGRSRIGSGLALGGALLLTVLTVNVGISGAAVENSTDPLQIRAVDNRNGKLVVDYMYTGKGDASAAQLDVNGTPATATADLNGPESHGRQTLADHRLGQPLAR